MNELYACVCAKEFPAQALLRLRPELRERPCVVMQGEPPLEQVCSLTRRARSQGIAHGMTKTEVETFPEAFQLARSAQEETAARAVLLECAGGFSPRVEECSQDGMFVCVLDIEGTEKLFGPPQTLAQTLLGRIRALGIAACIAVSRNFHAAIALAKGLPPRTPIQVVAESEERAALAPLPLSVLDIADPQAEVFALWGIRTLGMLAELPEKELVARMGQDGKRLRELARGEHPHLFRPVEPALTLTERIELDMPVELLDSLLFVIGAMLDQLIVRAQNRIVALAAVSVALNLEGGATHTRTVRPALPANDKQLWLKLLHLDLEAHPPHAPILALQLQADPGATSKVQLGLFAPQLPEPSRLDVTLARIRALVGEGNVGRPALKDTHQADAFRMEEFRLSSAVSKPVENRKALKAAKNLNALKGHGFSHAIPAAKIYGALAPEGSSSSSSPARPARRCLRPPEILRMIVNNHRPSTFLFREQTYCVDRAYGPWRSSGHWWNATRWDGEQWDLVAHTREGALLCCCAIHDALRNEWRMAALYD